MKRLILLALFAASAAADPLADVRTVLGRLKGREPIRATYELQRSVQNEGRFNDDKSSGRASVELEADTAGVRISFARPMLEQIEREETARLRDRKLQTPTGNTLRQIDPVTASRALDFARELLQKLEGATLREDRAGTFAGRPARILVLRALDTSPETKVGKVTVAENKLTLWLGDDGVPMAVEHLRAVKFSVLVIKGEARQKDSWHLARVGDRLVPTRHEASESGSGMGQKGSESSVATLRVH